MVPFFLPCSISFSGQHKRSEARRPLPLPTSEWSSLRRPRLRHQKRSELKVIDDSLALDCLCIAFLPYSDLLPRRARSLPHGMPCCLPRALSSPSKPLHKYQQVQVGLPLLIQSFSCTTLLSNAAALRLLLKISVSMRVRLNSLENFLLIGERVPKELVTAIRKEVPNTKIVAVCSLL